MALNWRDVTTLELTNKLIPDPNAGHNFLDRLQNVRVAIEGGFLHIDPRKDAGSSQDLFIVPAATVHKVAYRVTEPAQTMIDVQVG